MKIYAFMSSKVALGNPHTEANHLTYAKAIAPDNSDAIGTILKGKNITVWPNKKPPTLLEENTREFKF